MFAAALVGRSFRQKASRALSTTAAKDPAVIVVGGAGAVGRSIVSEFNSHKWATISADLVPNSEAAFNLQLPDPAAVGLDAWRSGMEALSGELPLDDDEPTVRAVVCAAGGWAGGAADSEEMLDSVVSMLQMNALSAAAAARLAGLALCRDGTGSVVFMGAAGLGTGSDATPGMMGYGMAKAATQQLANSLSAPGSGLAEGSEVLCVLPVTIDTPGNRSAMPDADTSSWTGSERLASGIGEWVRSRSGVAQDALLAGRTGVRGEAGRVLVETEGGVDRWVSI